MYLFPQIKLPPKAIEFAESQGKCVDEIYAMELLNATGVCVIPGSGFLQLEGTYHFRCTFLPPENEIDQFISKIETFHNEFLTRFT
jgi:aspartate/methionine/tyrosine aminotransferase